MVKVPFKTIKIREETYENINIFCRKNKPSQFAGGWKMDDKELDRLRTELKEIWKLIPASL